MLGNWKWLPFGIGRRIADRRRAKEYADAIANEDVVDNIGEAKYVVMQANGHLRYVRSRLVARLGDVAIRKDEFIDSIAWGKKEKRQARRPRGLDV